MPSSIDRALAQLVRRVDPGGQDAVPFMPLYVDLVQQFADAPMSVGDFSRYLRDRGYRIKRVRGGNLVFGMARRS
ncbi:hypothetical protein AB0N87_07765 [Streptomyces sp. NPDC093228]|uniref:hypothetical protein n=1 Tax=Streptomyces sp. NPDC093228 TaxID=3155070 RepID=UPI00342A8149